MVRKKYQAKKQAFQIFVQRTTVNDFLRKNVCCCLLTGGSCYQFILILPQPFFSSLLVEASEVPVSVSASSVEDVSEMVSTD